MKKIISIVLLCTMLLTCFAGCGAKKGQIDLNSYAGDVESVNLAAGLTTNLPESLGATYDTYSGTRDLTWYYSDVGAKTVADPAVDAETGESYYVLDSAEDFMGFQYLIANSVMFEGVTVRLTTDIQINAVKNNAANTVADYFTSATPYKVVEIAGNDTDLFKGVFDGQGHVISGLYHPNGTSNNRSFFGPLSGATIKNVSIVDALMDYGTTRLTCSILSIYSHGNVTLSNVYVASTLLGGTGKMGSLIGEVKDGSVSISNCKVNSRFTSPNSNGVGGMIGQVTQAANVSNTQPAISISNSESIVNIGGTASSHVGAFIGNVHEHATDTTYHVAFDVSITDSKASGTLSGKATVGGAIGNFGNSSASKKSFEIKGCDIDVDVTSHTGGQTGGLIGGVAAKTFKVENCTVSGDVTYKGATGAGLLGNVNCGSAEIKNCTVSGTTMYNGESILPANNLVGGYIGQFTSGALTMDSCTFSGSVTGNRCTGGLIGGAHSTKNLIIRDCTVSGTVICLMNGEKNLAAGGLVGNLRSNNAYFAGNTFSGTLEVDFQTVPAGSASKNWHSGAGAIIGEFSDYTGTDKLLRLVDNTVSGSMKVIKTDTATQSDWGYFAGVFLGCSNGQSRVEYIGDNTVTQEFTVVKVDEEANPGTTNVDVRNGGGIGGDMLKIEGYQLSQKNTETNTYNIRFVASTRGDYDAYGFVVGLKYLDAQNNAHEKLTTIYAEYLYETIKGTNEDGTVETYAAEDFYGEYLYTLEVRNVPASYVEAAAGEEKFGITLLPFGVTKETTVVEEVETTTTTNIPGVPYTFGKLPTGAYENTISLTNVGAYQSLDALYKPAEGDVVVTPTYEFAKDSYKDNLYFGVDTANGGDDYCLYPSTNSPYNGSSVNINTNMLTYSVGEDVEEGTYDLVLKLRVKNTTSRKLIMYLNDGQDAYQIGYASESVVAFSATETENSCYVKVGTFTFKDGDTITFKIDSAIGAALHVRGLYLVDPATDVAAAEPQA